MTTLTTKQETAIQWNKEFYAKQAEGQHGKRWVENRVNKVIEEHNKIAEANEITLVKIYVNWKNHNAYAKVVVYTRNKEGYANMNEYLGNATGYGYDKESSAVGQCFNQSEELLKLAYDSYDDNKEGIPYGLNNYDSGLSFGQGVGMSCYRSIAKYFDYKWTEEHGFDTSDFYMMELVNS